MMERARGINLRISGSGMIRLPRCDDLDQDFYLTPTERRELLVEMATRGVGAINKYVEKMAKDKDSAIARRIEKVRKDLESQSRSLREAMDRRFRARRKGLSDAYMKLRERTREGELEDRMKTLVPGQSISLEDLGLEEDSLIDIILDMDKYGRERGWFGRFIFRVKELMIKVVGALVRFFAWLLIKMRIMKPKERHHDVPPYQFMLSFDAMRSPYASIESNLTEAISSSPDMAQVVKNRMGGGIKGALKAAWERMKDPLGFRKRVQDMIAEELKDKLKESKKESVKKKEELERLLEAEQRRQEELQEEERKKVKELDEEEKKAMDEMYKEMSREPIERVKEEITEEFEKMGLLEKKDDELEITSRLIEIFSDIVFSIEVKNIPSHFAAKFGGGGVSTGIYNTRRMQSISELSRMDMVRSMVESRIYYPHSRHIYDENIYVYEEEKGSWQHVVLAFDKSGSMAENSRMEAAKRAVLALYKAVKNSNPDNVIDLVSFDTRVKVMDLLEVWSAEPTGFTNTGEALRVSDQLLRNSRTAKKSIYLITDGLPEAYSADEREYAGDFDKSMEYALEHAAHLRKIPTLKFTIILLEVKDKRFIEAAEKISKVLDGTIIMTNPEKLASELLIEYSKTRIG